MLEISRYTIPLLLLAIPLFAALRGVEVWNSFIRGAKGLCCGSGSDPVFGGDAGGNRSLPCLRALDFFVGLLSPVGRICGILRLPLALLRPLSAAARPGLVGSDSPLRA